MATFTEFLIVKGQIEREYQNDLSVRSPELLDLWKPLIDRLLDKPSERMYHGLVGLPYWEVSMALSEKLKHPSLEGCFWICFYAAPNSEEPFYVGALIPKGLDFERIDLSVSLICAVSGDSDPEKVASVFNRAANSKPLLVGAYWRLGLPDDVKVQQRAIMSTGECAAAIAQLALEAISA